MSTQRTADKPRALPVDAAGIPEELKTIDRWVVWRWTWKPDEQKWDKPPFCAADPYEYASVSNPRTWGTFADAMEAYTHKRCDGIGFVLGDVGDGRHVSGVDLDDCVTPAVNGTKPALEPWARQLLVGWDSFAEYSPSGTGVKGLCWGCERIPHSVKSARIELYPNGRYFTLTGHKLEHMPDELTAAPHETGALERLFTTAQEEKQAAQARAREQREASRQAAYVAAALERERDAIAGAVEGTRHNQTLASTRALFGLVDTGLLSEQQVIDLVSDASSLPDTEIADILSWARTHPSDRSVPDFSQLASSPHPTMQAPAGAAELQPADYNRSDAGNGELFVRLFGAAFRYDRTRDAWLIWTGDRWTVDTAGAADISAVAVARVRKQWAVDIGDADAAKGAFAWATRSEQRSGVAGTLELARVQPGMSVAATDYDTHPLLAGVPGGTLDLALGVARDAQREDRITQQLGVAYDALAPCPRWQQFLLEVFAGDRELVRFVQRAVGYSLTGDTCEHSLFLLHGSGANGKSVFLNTLLALAGEYGAATSFDTFSYDRRSEATNDLAALRAARLVVASESEEDKRLAEARVKALTGGDPITCRFLHREFFTYKPMFKVWLATNHLPHVRGTQYSIWRRIKLIPFTVRFTETADKGLEATLRTELPGILNWALAGLADWRNDGLGTCAAVAGATERYRTESDLIGQWLEDCTVPDLAERVPMRAAYASYKDWCSAQGHKPWSSKGFGQVLLEHDGIGRGQQGAIRYYDGFRLVANGYEE